MRRDGKQRVFRGVSCLERGTLRADSHPRVLFCFFKLLLSSSKQSEERQQRLRL